MVIFNVLTAAFSMDMSGINRTICFIDTLQNVKSGIDERNIKFVSNILKIAQISEKKEGEID